MDAPRRAGVGGYLGRVGSLVELPIASALNTDEDRPSSLVSTLGGSRVAFFAPSSRRTWQVSLPGQRPHEWGALVELLRASPGPHVWVSPYAQVTNVLTPAQALAAVAAGKDVGPVPVVPGMPVTGAVHAATVAAGAQITLRWLTAAGFVIATTPRVLAAAASPSRPSVSGVAPAGAAQVALTVSQTVGAPTRPTISWTADLLDWAPGHGCAACVAVAIPGEHVATHAVPHGTRTVRSTLELQEVG